MCLRRDRVDLRFTNVLRPGEPFSCLGVIAGRSDGGRRRADVAVWARKADGSSIIDDTASALERRRPVPHSPHSQCDWQVNTGFGARAHRGALSTSTRHGVRQGTVECGAVSAVTMI